MAKTYRDLFEVLESLPDESLDTKFELKIHNWDTGETIIEDLETIEVIDRKEIILRTTIY